MKKDAYEKAKQKILRLSEESVIPGVHSLDYVMGVKDMSETDRIFYEAYKLYGNRDHTWQYFKQMFKGDVQQMQKTVKNWKTWDEINKLPEGQVPVANYSTYNPKIAQLEMEIEQKLKSKNLTNKERKQFIKEYMEKMYNLINMENGDFVVAERIGFYRKIIIENPDMLQKAISFYFLTPEERIEFIKTLLDKSAERFGLPKSQVVQIEKLPLKTRFSLFGIVAGYDNETNIFYIRGEERDLVNMLEIIVHENGHRIDFFNPNMGMIGTQILKWSNPNYIRCDNVLSPKSRNLYFKNPTELSSYYLGEPVAAALTKAVDDIKFPKGKSILSVIKNIFVRD